ncbi:MAG: hypothetical protein WBD20_08855 [Pirellulaceae bacterium]
MILSVLFKCGHAESSHSNWRGLPALMSQWTLIALAVLFVTAGLVSSSLAAGSPNEQSASQPAADEQVITFGITGHYRIGRWTAVKINDASLLAPEAISMETLDGDGMRVVYDLPADSQPKKLAYGYVVPGTEAAPLVFRSGTDTIVTSRFPEFGSPSRGPSAIPVDMPWVVCLGDPLGVDQIGANKLLDRDAQIAVSIPRNASELPDSLLGYQGVNVLMVNASGAVLLGELESSQQTAITDWVKTGGHVFLTLGESAKKLSNAAPWLIDLLPVERDIETVSLSPSAIETYTSTQNPLNEFVGAQLPKDVGEVLLTGRTTRRVSIPIAVDYIVGLGRVTVLAADLESETFAAWPERMDLIQRVTGGVFSITKDERSGNRITTFDDLVGQTRATLDQFPVKRKFGFSVLALILLALIALIGPLDYWVVNRVLGKPLLGWLTFPIVALGLSAVLAMWSLPWTSQANRKVDGGSQDATSVSMEADSQLDEVVQCNRIEFVDVDAVQNVGRGFAWSYLYSHPANQFDVDVQPSKSLRAVAAELTQNTNAPFGTPGPSFGGIQIAGEDARLPAYHVEMTRIGDAYQSQVKDLAIAPRSSKSLATHLQFTPVLAEIESIKRRRGSELLEGKLTNPLSVDLLDAMLVYGNWVYLLPTRFRGGSTIDSLADLRQKNFRWRLARQEMLEKSNVKNESWVATNFGSPSRMAEMLMFHESVGGSRYTGLKHSTLNQLDFSDLLVDDRCILVGRFRDPLLGIKLRDVHQTDGEDVDFQPPGRTLSMIRVVLPVETSGTR